MKTRVVVALLAITLLLAAAYPALAQLNTDEQSEALPTPMSDPYQEDYIPCTNARYRAWFGAS
ncbi:MAG: hypothetical protein ABIJ47_09250 [Candidatus Bathyarchaeota archaeon]